MKQKPSSCTGCPWYQDGVGYVSDEQATGSVFILMQNPGRIEEEFGLPAQGQAGKDMDSNFLPLAGLVRGQSVTVGNVLKCRWAGGNDLTWDDTQRQAVSHCTEAHLRIPEGTRLIIAQGKLAFQYAHGGNLRSPEGRPASITDWRGFIIPLEYTRPRFGEVPVFVTLHTADLYHNPTMEVVTEWDWIKVKDILDGTYPKPLPPRQVVTADTMAEARQWFADAREARWVTCDTEFEPGTKYLTVLGLLARYPDGRIQGLQVDWREALPEIREEISTLYKELVRHVPIIFHNCRADIPVLESACKVRWGDYLQYEDTMLAHAVLWCELPHGLEFIASVWGCHTKLKHLKNNDELLYNFGDVLETDNIWRYISEQGFKHDPLAESVYRSQHLKLAPILERTIDRGLRVNRDRVVSARMEYESKVVQALELASATAGWPINLNSPQQLSWYLYTIRGLPLQCDKDTGNPSINDDAVAKLRMELGPPFDPEEDLTYEKALERIEQGADPILEARVLYIGASTRLIKYIYCLYSDVAKIKAFDYATKGAYEKARDLAIERVKSGLATAILERIHPDMLTHSQKTGRWSTVDPPIAQLPSDLRDLVCPDEGQVWIKWDWSAIEPRILEGYCNSKILRRAFDEGIDLHTWTVCAAFGYDFPPNLIDPHKSPESKEWREKYRWKGKDDPRRVFAKTARYEMYYGGTGANAAASAALFGLDPKVLKRACAALISADPEYYSWRLNIEETIKRTRVLRTFMGRPRRFLKGGHKMVREGLDQPMQGGVSDIANTTVVMLDEQTEAWFQFAWSMHDSQNWHCPREQATPEFIEWVRSVAARPHTINGRAVAFPIDLEVVYPPGEHVIPGLEKYTHE